MKRYFILLTGILFLLPQRAYATTSVTVSSNGEGSTSKVTINNNTTSTQGSTSVENRVRIETNGEVQEFNTSGDESVDWSSQDGKSSVKINTKTTTANATPSPTPQSSESGKTTQSQNEDEKAKKDEEGNPISSFITILFTSIFSILGLGESK